MVSNGCIRWNVISYGSISTHAARLVATGYAKKYGNYYEETLNIAVRMTTIRVLLPLTVTKN